jgi:hypothetical protein
VICWMFVRLACRRFGHMPSTCMSAPMHLETCSGRNETVVQVWLSRHSDRRLPRKQQRMHGSGQQSRLPRWCGAGGGLPRCTAATLGEHDESPRSQSVQWMQPTALHRVTLVGRLCLLNGQHISCRPFALQAARQAVRAQREAARAQLEAGAARQVRASCRGQSTWYQQQSADS